MFWRRAILVTCALLVLCVGLALLLPNSPWYWPELMAKRPQHQGGSTGHWIDQLDTKDDEKKREAIFNLGAIGPEAAEAVPRLAVILREDPEGETRNAAALALTKMTPASGTAAADLGAALQDSDYFVRMNAAICLARLKADAKPAVPNLIKAVKDQTNRTNIRAFGHTILDVAALALGRASRGSTDGVGPLTEALDVAITVPERRALARALGEIGPEARPAVERLRALKTDQDADFKAVVEEALGKIEGKPGPKKQ